MFRVEIIDVPPATEITLAVPEGESLKSVEELLGTRTESSTSSSTVASGWILDILERSRTLAPFEHSQ